MIIRKIEEKDTELYLELLKKLDEETEFMKCEPGERKIAIDEMRARIRTILTYRNSIITIAEENDQFIGFLSAYGGMVSRNRHCVFIVIGILKAYTGKGIGRKLFDYLEEWAYENNVTRFELTVMVNNENAIKLYDKIGFKKEGIKENSVKINDKYIDEYYMSKILPDKI